MSVPVFCDSGENEIMFLNGPKLLDDDVKYFPSGYHVASKGT